MKVGILCNGRHIGTENWGSVVWGRDGKMGQIPTALAVMRDYEKNGDQVSVLVFGTGVSEHNGVPEAQVMVDYTMNNLHRLPNEFPTFSDLTPDGVTILGKVLRRIVVLETTSKNTVEEVAAAMRIFEKEDVDKVVDVTCRTHAARCRRDIDTVMEQNSFNIPSHRVSVVSSETHYPKVTSAAEVGILEPPHRGDTPANFWSFYHVMMDISKKFYVGNYASQRGILLKLRKTETP